MKSLAIFLATLVVAGCAQEAPPTVRAPDSPEPPWASPYRTEARHQTESVQCTLEKKDGHPVALVVKTLKGGQPEPKEIFTITVGINNAKGRTDKDGVFRVDLDDLKSQIYVPGLKDVPTMSGCGDKDNAPVLVEVYKYWQSQEKAQQKPAESDADAEVSSGECKPERAAKLASRRGQASFDVRPAGGAERQGGPRRRGNAARNRPGDEHGARP